MTDRYKLGDVVTDGRPAERSWLMVLGYVQRTVTYEDFAIGPKGEYDFRKGEVMVVSLNDRFGYEVGQIWSSREDQLTPIQEEDA